MFRRPARPRHRQGPTHPLNSTAPYSDPSPVSLDAGGGLPFERRTETVASCGPSCSGAECAPYAQRVPESAKPRGVRIVAKVKAKGGRPAKPWLPGAAPVQGDGYLGIDSDGDADTHCRRLGWRQIWDCPCCGQLHWGELPCRKLDCHHCQEDVSRRRGSRKHEIMGGAGLGAWVVTIPRHWASRVTGASAWRFRRAVAALILDAYAEVRRVRVGCVAVLHPEGDKGDHMHHLDGLNGEAAELGAGEIGPQPARLETWGPHVHATVPLAGLRAGRVVRMRGYQVTARLVDAVKARAQVLLDAMADGLGVEPALANVHYRYMKADDPARVGHRLRYDLRSFPDWGATDCKDTRKAMRVQGFGLLGPAARCSDCGGSANVEGKNPCACAAGLRGYREAIAYQNDDETGYACRPCLQERGERVKLVLMLVTKQSSYIWEHLKSICLPLDRAGEGASGAATGPP